MTSQRKDASAEVLLCRDGVPPELLAAKLDALDSDARFALFDKKKNIAAVASKLAEVRAPRFNHTHQPQLFRIAPRRAAPPHSSCCDAWRACMQPSPAVAAWLRSDSQHSFPAFAGGFQEKRAQLCACAPARAHSARFRRRRRDKCQRVRSYP